MTGTACVSGHNKCFSPLLLQLSMPEIPQRFWKNGPEPLCICVVCCGYLTHVPLAVYILLSSQSLVHYYNLLKYPGWCCSHCFVRRATERKELPEVQLSTGHVNLWICSSWWIPCWTRWCRIRDEFRVNSWEHSEHSKTLFSRAECTLSDSDVDSMPPRDWRDCFEKAEAITMRMRSTRVLLCT